MDNILLQLEQVLEARKTADKNKSYVSYLYNSGLHTITSKIKEETSELIEAANNNNKKHIIHEVTDLWFHTMVLLKYKNINIDNITKELSRRFNMSGLIEKANRKHKD